MWWLIGTLLLGGGGGAGASLPERVALRSDSSVPSVLAASGTYRLIRLQQSEQEPYYLLDVDGERRFLHRSHEKRLWIVSPSVTPLHNHHPTNNHPTKNCANLPAALDALNKAFYRWPAHYSCPPLARFSITQPRAGDDHFIIL